MWSAVKFSNINVWLHHLGHLVKMQILGQEILSGARNVHLKLPCDAWSMEAKFYVVTETDKTVLLAKDKR